MLKLFLQSLQRCLFRPLRVPLRCVRILLQCGEAGWLPAEFFLGSTCSMWEKWLYDLTKSHFQAPETERSLVASLRLASHQKQRRAKYGASHQARRMAILFTCGITRTLSRI